MESLRTQKKTVRHKLKEGSNILRILPPFGEACNGYPYVYWSVIWGLCDPNSGNERPFADCKTTEGKSPVWEYLDLLRVKVKKIETEMITAGKSEVEIKEHLKETNTFISRIKPRAVYCYNAADKAGTAGILEIKSTAHKALLKLMNEYIADYNQDPTSLNSEDSDSGVWFDFTRIGVGFDTEYSVKKNQVKVKTDKGMSYQDDRSPLSEAITADYEISGYDLTTIYQEKSYNELRDILVSNLESLAEKNPILYIEEFMSAGTSKVKATAVTTAPRNTKSAEKKVELKLEKAEDVSTDEEMSAEEMMKMAEDIFNK